MSLAPVVSDSRDSGRALRFALRVPGLLVHLLLALPLTVLAINPLTRRLRTPAGERWDHRVIRWWSATLLRVFGMRVRRFGTPMPQAGFYVANHVSWIDIEALHSQRMMGFVAKQEIRGWPVVGWLAAQAFRVSTADRRAVMIEGGMQNAGLALGIIAVQFGSDLDMVIVASLWGIWHIVSGMSLAFWWRHVDARHAV